jgi:transcriptional regulator with XRE-family HTH domain
MHGLAFPGCTVTYISRIEAGERVPSLQVLVELGQRLGVTAEWLARGIKAENDDAARIAQLEDRVAVLEGFLLDVRDGNYSPPAMIDRINVLLGRQAGEPPQQPLV